MKICSADTSMIPALRELWKASFGDADEYLDVFFDTAFSPERCRCITVGETLACALYILDCEWNGGKLGYIYAVATAEDHRGRGLCRMLMENTEDYMRSKGYTGAILVPGDAGLFCMYEKLGYRVCSKISEFTCEAAEGDLTLRKISPEKYAARRRELMPRGAVTLDGVRLKLLAETAELYAAEGILLAAHTHGDELICHELLGDVTKAGEAVFALGHKKGFFRTVGEARDFAMYKGFCEGEAPSHFGIAFDL